MPFGFLPKRIKQVGEDMEKHWRNIELEAKEALIFKAFLNAMEVKQETSGAGSLTHFEVYVDSREESKCSDFLAVLLGFGGKL